MFLIKIMWKNRDIHLLNIEPEFLRKNNLPQANSTLSSEEEIYFCDLHYNVNTQKK